MATLLHQLYESASRPVSRLGKWARRAWLVGLVVLTGYVVGGQIAAPNKRTLQVLVAAILVTGALKVESLVGLLILIPLFPFPKFTSYGSTNVAFVVFIFIIWLVRVTLRAERSTGKSQLDLPVLVLVSAYLLSFSQIDSTAVLRGAFSNFFYALTFIAFGYLAIQLIRTEDQLKRVIGSVTVMAVLVQLVALFELFFPHRALVPGWIDPSHDVRTGYIQRGLEITNLRVGGPFSDYELLAEFCAMISILLCFQLVRAQTLWGRLGFGALLILDTFVLFATVTRGAIFALGAAAAYMLWKARRHLRFHVFVLILTGALGGSWFILDLVANQTRSGNILVRLQHTEFHGAVPDNRRRVWTEAWDRVQESPIFGHGPYFSHREGVRQFFWPHNNYLFYWHITGIIGLAGFLFVLYRVWRSTDRLAPQLGRAGYTEGLLFALRGMLILFVIDQIKIDYIRNVIYPYWVWLFFGVAIAAGRIAQVRAESSRPQPDVSVLPRPASRPTPAVAPQPSVALRDV